MCATCDNFQCDLAAWGITCLDFWGNHYLSRSERVIDVKFKAGPHMTEGVFHLLIRAIRDNYSCRNVRMRTIDDEHYVFINRLLDINAMSCESSSEVRKVLKHAAGQL